MSSQSVNETSKKDEMRFEPFDNSPVAELMTKHLPIYKDLITILPANTRMTSNYEQFHTRFQEFKSKESDVWIATYPKAGTTWTQELVWCLLFTLENPRITDVLTKRSPFFEWDSLFGEDFKLDHLAEDDLNKPGVMWRLLQEDLPSPRNIKTHLHRALLPPSLDQHDAKIVYVARDPRDLCTSLYYHSVKLDGYTGTFDQFVDIFLNDSITWSPYWSHVLSYWNQRDRSNVFFITFEEMKKDLGGAMKKFAAFLGVERPGCAKGELPANELKQLVHHCDFQTMKTNPAVNNEKLFATIAVKINNEEQNNITFMRKGQVGDHKSHLSKEQLNRFQQWTAEALRGTDFPYYQNYDK